MNNTSSTPQASSENDANFNNPAMVAINQKDNSIQDEMFNVFEPSDDVDDELDSKPNLVESAEQMAVVNNTLNSNSNNDSSISQMSGALNNYNISAQRSTTLETAGGSASCSSHSENTPSERKYRYEPQSKCPPVNCPEKIIICLDLNEEMDSTMFRSKAGDKYTGLELAKRAIKMFVMHKTQMNPKHEFAFVVFHEEPTMLQSFTSRARDILETLDETKIETQKSGPMNLSHLFEIIKKNIELPVVNGDSQVIPPPYIVRVILLFGRSHCVPVVTSTEAQRELESSPYFFTDVLYIHETPVEGNKCEEIFSILCDLDHNGMSYIFEQSKYTPILNSGAKLLAHPLQRPRQLEAMYKIGPIHPTTSVPISVE